jgi:hypothetical protein
MSLELLLKITKYSSIDVSKISQKEHEVFNRFFLREL